MSWAFITYLTVKGLKKIWPSIIETINTLPLITLEVTSKPTFSTALVMGFIVSIIVYISMRARLKSSVTMMDNTRESINTLFTIPLIFSAALLSFAHGANDVANAIGPLAAINDAVLNGGISSKAEIPLWVMGVGALGIALGLALYGPKLIKTVGSEITDLDQIRAFSIAMAASITVIIASQLGLPVSSTHIAIGGVFGVGFLREYLHLTSPETSIEEDMKVLQSERDTFEAYTKELRDLEAKPNKHEPEYERIVELYHLRREENKLIKSTKRHMKRTKKVEYVKRDAMKKIFAAWIITVPAAAILSGLLFFMIKGIMI
jgi:PiT family inorganic phosphate transporter